MIDSHTVTAFELVLKVSGPIDLAMYTREYMVEKAMKRFVIDERYYQQRPETSSKVCDGISRESVFGARWKLARMVSAQGVKDPTLSVC